MIKVKNALGLFLITIGFPLLGILVLLPHSSGQVIAQSQDVDLSFSPSSGSYTVGETVSIKSHLAGHGQEHNIVATGVKIGFDKSRLRLLSVDCSDSPLTSQMEAPDTDPKIAAANTNGSFEVALGNTGTPSRTPFDIFEINFEAIASGTAAVYYTSAEEQEIINDAGNQPENILSVAVTGGSFSIVPAGGPTATPPPATPTIAPGKANFNFKLRFQGVYVKRPDKQVKLIFMQGSTEVSNLDVSVTSANDGIYSGSVYNYNPGTYDLYIVGPVHLQKKFALTLAEGVNSQDWSTSKLLAGDCQLSGGSANKVDIQDVTLLSQNFGSKMSAAGTRADLDFDSDVDIFDLSYISENFGKTGDLPSGGAGADVNLSLPPSSGSYPVGNNNIIIKSHLAGQGQEYEIASVGIRIEFDKSRLRLLAVNTDQSPLETKMIVPITAEEIAQANTDGKVRVSLGTLADSIPRTPFDIFELKFEALVSGTATVSYSAVAEQVVTANRSTDNALTAVTTGSSYQITAN